jgi:ribosomal protein S18 acetylase RimI-like enzyme
MTIPFTIDTAQRHELPAAFRLILQTVADDDERDRRIANALRLLERGELDRKGVFVAREGSRLAGALVCLPVPGASGLVWPPQIMSGLDPVVLEDRLLAHATAWLKKGGAKLGQALLTPDERPFGRSLARNGFKHVTRLSYLRHYLDLPISLLLVQERLSFQSYRRADRPLFHKTLLRTYEGTLDCPEVNGVRSIEDVIAGHQSQGMHDSGRWWLAFDGAAPVGVLLLIEMPEAHYWELAYLGVIPEARGQGYGHELVRKALFEARAGEAGQLSLSVDERNLPACKLYRRLGFESFDEREVYLAIWR